MTCFGCVLLQGMSSRHFLRELGSRCVQKEIVHRSNICLFGPQRRAALPAEELQRGKRGGVTVSHCDDENTTVPAASPPRNDGSVGDVAASLAALKRRAKEGKPEWAAAAAAATNNGGGLQ